MKSVQSRLSKHPTACQGTTLSYARFLFNDMWSFYNCYVKCFYVLCDVFICVLWNCLRDVCVLCYVIFVAFVMCIIVRKRLAPLRLVRSASVASIRLMPAHRDILREWIPPPSSLFSKGGVNIFVLLHLWRARCFFIREAGVSAAQKLFARAVSVALCFR